HLDIVDVSASEEAVKRALDERDQWCQLFGVYQSNSAMQSAIMLALDRRCKVAIASEAPCNMFPPSARRIAKNIYMKRLLRRRLPDIVEGVSFIINWSGEDAISLRRLGWAPNKIIPCGYFSPPLVGSRFGVRENSSLDDIHILCTGYMTWHRGPDVLMEALCHLDAWGIRFRATFTGNGPLEQQLQATSERYGLACDFPGLVSMSKLIDLYENCTVFVAAGREEPWGMRVNDALNAGAPSIVSRGMGACKLIFDYGGGVTFAAGDAVDLAWKLRSMITDENNYHRVCQKLLEHRDAILPCAAAARIANILRSDFPEWLEGAAS
ncbi:MAG: glycosyltransferase family 4 protein, partial [Hyphomicrobiaceae bacterium]